MVKSGSPRPRLLIVGGFRVSHDGLTGGTYAACKQLVNSKFAEIFDLALIDISQVSPRSRHVGHRLFAGLWRVLQVLWLVLTQRLDGALIFATIGMSWIERHLMSLICRAGGIPAFIFPRHSDVILDIARPGLARNLTRRAVRAGVRYIFQGASVRRGFLAEMPEAVNQTSVIGNWISLDWFDTVKPMTTSDTVTALYVGWLRIDKGLDVLLNALALQSDRFRNTRFVICGDGVERENLERQAATLPIPVEFRGWAHGDDKRKAFSESDLIVLPSRSEGMPNLLLEAMAASRPLVACNVGCVSDLVDSGVEGILVPADDPERLAEALSALIADPGLRLRTGQAGRARIERDHNTDRSWQILARLINDEIGRDGGRALSADILAEKP